MTGNGSDSGSPGSDSKTGTGMEPDPDPGSPETVVAREGVTFRRTPERDLTLDVYRPATGAGVEGDDAGSTGDESFPAFVYVHGGAWRDRNPDEYRDGLRRVAARGFVCVNLTYRVSGEASYPAAVEDVAHGVGWTHALDGVDAARVAVGGLSAGAHLATLVANAGERFAPSDVPAAPDVAAAVGFSGVYDVASGMPDAAGPEDDPADEGGPFAAFLGGSVTDVPERYREASPAEYAGAAPPTLLAHGTADDVLPYANAVSYRDRLREAGRRVAFETADGGSHLFPFEEPWFARTADRLAGFLDATI